MLSRRKKSITGKLVAKQVPKIKPSKARRIIRRFHLLIQKRRVICSKLQCLIVEDDEEANAISIEKFFKKNKSLRQSYMVGKNSTRLDPNLEELLVRAQNVNSSRQLCELLGYICREIDEDGGLKNYQMASTVGQDSNRGGDSSKLLVKWCKELSLDKTMGMNALELGSLSAKNNISTCGIFNPVVRVDLNSNDTVNIEKQDFMERPLPENESEQFDLISCSLVLNFVPTPIQRGQMILRFQHFLKRNQKTYLFIVMPLPCLANSRYMTKERFNEMMNCLGYREVRYKAAKKVAYWLFNFEKSDDFNHTNTGMSRFTKKVKLADKPGMNNFAIIIPSKYSGYG
ncbi:unnamed protein product [Kluyveromyces dobzhanskii CBS 2104]|uniref:25S rRNA adenine-N(1) methyltransferase n=1 Tax=Kluyveromyces dobzhanskii CBS 2104 TaxID=1427455 RepID=A0A0A8L541_9SACH|nr:unnamed protein product [Kluyveromyces dobzhanskii CBS 2104]